MKTVQVLDRKFELSISAERISQEVKRVAAQMDKDFEGKNPIMLGTLNGAFVFTADLVRAMSIPMEVTFVKMASYSGMSSTGEVKQLVGLKENIEGRTVVIVEDIIDSGRTMVAMLEMLKAMKPAEIKICSLLVKPDALKVKLDIDYVCLNIPNDFIVGYGLDYDGYGRELPDIYTCI